MINEHVFLSGPGLVLVPYLKPFVPRYHEWMCDPDLLAATESEPLSLEEEYDNQHSWLQSTDKLTFIILAPVNELKVTDEGNVVSLKDALTPIADAFGGESTAFASANARFQSQTGSNAVSSLSSAASFPWCYPGSIVQEADYTCAVQDSGKTKLEALQTSSLLKRFAPYAGRDLFGAVHAAATTEATTGLSSVKVDVENSKQNKHVAARSYAMIGDCNLFLLAEDEDSDDNDGAIDWSSTRAGTKRSAGLATATSVIPPSHTFEVEVMVADVAFRRRGLAELAVRMIMQYAMAVCGATRFVAKILVSNTGSISLFTERLKFDLFKEVKVFHELHYTRSFKSVQERLAWADECEERGRARCHVTDASEADDPTFWCGLLTEDVASSLRIYKQLPEGCSLL